MSKGMIRTDVIIIGGGPAGAACAWRLKQRGANCLILDQSAFPRAKTCAGWITPQALKDLEIRASDYPHGMSTYSKMHISFRGFPLRIRTHQYGIRRFEFDHWLLRRCGAPLQIHSARQIIQARDGYIVDGEIFGAYLVGAGGTSCPVYRSLFQSISPRNPAGLITAMEEEFPYEFTDPHCHLWFMENDLPGYAWYVPKRNGYVNVGVGGKALDLKNRNDTLKNHWGHLLNKLEKMKLVGAREYKPHAYAYYQRQEAPELRIGNAFVVGDAAGLATQDMGEGIGPAIRSGLLAAEAILTGSSYDAHSIPRYSLWPLFLSGFMRA